MSKKALGIILTILGLVLLAYTFAGLLLALFGIAEIVSYRNIKKQGKKVPGVGVLEYAIAGILVFIALANALPQPAATQQDSAVSPVVQDTEPEKPKPAKEKPLPLTRENLLKLVNEERAKVGVAPLVVDDMLNQSAQWKSDDMLTYGYFSHIKPGESRNNGLDYLDGIDIHDRCKYISENIVNNVSTHTGKPFNDGAVGTIRAWVNSKSHYEAMVDPKYTLTGFGISGTYVTQHFCQQ